MKTKIFSIIATLLSSTTAIFGATSYQMQDLGLLEYEQSWATSINEKGEVCGLYSFNNEQFLFFWNPNEGLFTTEIQTQIAPILNTQGQIAGTITTKDWFSTTVYPFTWSFKAGLNKLDPSYDAYVTDMNDEGLILLNHADAYPSSSYALVWKEDTFNQIPPSELLVGIKLTAKSEIVGYRVIQKGAEDFYCVPIIYNPANHVSKKLILQHSAYARDSNEKGQVIGQYLNPKINQWCGFLWDSKEGLIFFDNFHPDTINNLGQIIGTNQNGKPMLWEKGQLHNLNDLLRIDEDQTNPWTSIEAILDINNRGQMVGWGIIGGKSHAFVITPVTNQNTK